MFNIKISMSYDAYDALAGTIYICFMKFYFYFIIGSRDVYIITNIEPTRSAH